MERYLMWSGGKDSSASIVLCYENNIHIDGIVMSEVMFDHSRNISGEDIEHITWVKNVAIDAEGTVTFVKNGDTLSDYYHL